jgi:hypothetical protein
VVQPLSSAVDLLGKKIANYKAFLHFACAWVTYRAAGVLG